MSLDAIAAADLRAIIAENPVIFTFNGTDYTGTRGGLNLRQPLELGGFQDEPEITLVVAISQADGSLTMNPLPEVNEQITIAGAAYRVERTERDAEGAGYQMDLRSANK